MISSEQHPWLIEPRTGRVTTYGELRSLLRDPANPARPLFRPHDTREALLAIARAIASGSDLTLFDRDFGPNELGRMGYAESDLNQPAPGRAADAVNSWGTLIAGGGLKGSRLTLFTSGSTGLPKQVTHEVGALARGVRVSESHRAAVWAFAYNPTHVAGVQVYLQALANENTLVDVYGCDRATVLAAIDRHGITHLSATPTFYRLLLPPERPMAAVRSVTLGGESSDAALLDRLRGLFPQARFHNIYASTEAGTLLVAEGDVFGISPALSDAVQLRDRRIHVHRRLLGNFAGAEQGGEWYDTGDVVEVVSESPLRFRIVARERDWVNVGGSKVNPHEVEDVLARHPGVRHARVYGRPNSVLGQILCAEVVAATPALAEAELRAHLGAHLQPFKVPRMIRFVASLSQTRSGKISRA